MLDSPTISDPDMAPDNHQEDRGQIDAPRLIQSDYINALESPSTDTLECPPDPKTEGSVPSHTSRADPRGMVHTPLLFYGEKVITKCTAGDSAIPEYIT